MNKFFRSLTVFSLFIISTALAANTTSTIKGKVIDSSGSSVAGASVVVTYTPTGNSRSVNSDEDGQFALLNLQVGGPYSISASSPSGTSSVDGVFLDLGKTSNVVLSLALITDVDEVIVTAEKLSKVVVATGPSVTFGQEELGAAAAYDRDIKELLQTHPRLYVDDGYEKGLQCNGQSPRYNSLTVDGISLNDGFGLNNNGYPSERMPFSYDAIQQVSAEFAPFDVTYGGFSSCVVNAVTKSGSNEFKGNVFYEFANDSLQGDELEGNSVTLVPYDEAKYGFTLGGPIIQDKLYFFTSYERYDDQDTNDYGYIGSGLPVEQQFLTKAMYDQIVSTSQNLYGFDPGGLAAALDSESDKLLVKLDYYINETTRAVYTFNYSDGFRNAASDASSSEFEFDKHFYKKGNELIAHMFKLYSTIGDLNTELRIGYRELDNSQIGSGGTFGDFQIDVFNPDTGRDGTVYLGGQDDSRQANKLDYDNLTIAFIGDYQLDNQLVTFGVEYEKQNIFNMFVQHSRGGEWDFNSIDDFIAGNARVYYGNAPSLDPADAGADWSYDVTTFFVQSEYQVSDMLEITYGLRYEEYGVSGQPALNQNFVDAYGYPNTATYDGANVLMPRISFSLNLDDDTEIYGGYGTFSGGNPNVWYSNMFSNDGVTNVQLNQRGISAFSDAMCDGRTGAPSSEGPGYAVPCSLVSSVQSGSANGDTNTIAGDFEVPTVNKFAIGLIKYLNFGPLEGAALNVDYISAKSKDAAVVRDIAVSRTGEYDFAGVPYYNCSSGNRGFSCFGPFDFELGNANDQGESESWSVSLSKYFDDRNLFVSIGYADIETKDVMPMTSSVAYSNYVGIATSDRNDPGVAVSNYNIPQRFTGTLRWSPEVFTGLDTRISFYWNHNKGRGYSYIMDGSPWGGTPAWVDNYLLYVPTGPNDSNVTFASGFDTEAFFAWADSRGLERGAITKRNGQYSDWFSKIDMKIVQELPSLREGDKFELYVTIRNLTNLLDSDKGIFKEAGFPRTQKAVYMDIDDAGRYNYTRLLTPAESEVVPYPSLWQAKIGLEYKF
tara:strand:- start:717 stop:3878 length:3162 start_codon:yes stop_codon:yes gene_type:complete